MSEPTEADTSIVEKKIPQKKERSEKQLAVLAKAREKASAVRKSNAELRQKEKALKQNEKNEHKKRIESEYEKTIKKNQAVQEVDDEPATDPEPEEPEEPEESEEPEKIIKKIKTKTKKKKKKPVVILVEESDYESGGSSDDEPQIIRVPKRSSKKKPAAPAATVTPRAVPSPPVDTAALRARAEFQRNYNAMFDRPLY